MQFPESWLRAFCNPALNTQELAELLTMSGLEVEELRPVAPPFHGIVVAEILTAEQHPNADKLRVCTVNAGVSFNNGEPLQIVCGAPNARVGIKVPLATVGAELPPGEDGKPFKINVGKLRGVDSFGMLCSARELKLSEEHGGLLELAADAQIGQNIREHLNLDDTLFTLKLTPNLAHALSVYGIAREVSALTGAPLQVPVIAPVAPRIDDKLPVRIEAADLCGRFSGRIIRGVNTQVQTPAWMVDRLARCGQRSVSPLVDISNYVMFEFGRPSHIFDLDKIHDELVVRWAKSGESLKLLNGNTVALDETVGVVADSQGVESLAGIMGGDATAVSDDTVNIYVEAAFWWPKAVMGRSRKFNFSTDAGHRFERGVDPALTAQHVERISQLIQDICGGSCGPLDDQTTQLPARTPVSLRVARASKIIGMPVTQEDCARVFTRLGLPFEQAPGVLTVTPPSWRFDMQIEEDLIEEVIRVIGYPNLPATPPLAPVVGKVASEARRSVHALRHAVAARDYFETINFSFVEARWERELAGNEQPIQVLNPIAAPLAVMRTSLLGSLVNTLRFNLARRATRVRLFEIGRVFLRDATVLESDASIAGVAQPMRVSGLAYGPAEQQQWSQRDRMVDFFDVKGDLEALFAPRQLRFVPSEHAALHPGRSARVELDGQDIGVIGELHPKWRQSYELPQGGGAPVLFELDLAAALQRAIPAAQAIPRQQAVLRDLAVIVDDRVSHDGLMAAIASAHDGLIRSAKLFDVFKPAQANADMKDGERSLAVRLELLDDEVTLTEERIDQTVAAVIDALSQRLGARLRG